MEQAQEWQGETLKVIKNWKLPELLIYEKNKKSEEKIALHFVSTFLRYSRLKLFVGLTLAYGKSEK